MGITFIETTYLETPLPVPPDKWVERVEKDTLVLDADLNP
jgi:hypothetical protein